MTLTDIERAAAVMFAVKEAGPNGSLQQMKAICQVLRNRHKNGWGESWLDVIEDAADKRGNPAPEGVRLSRSDRRLQQLAREIDDIYFGNAADEVTEAVDTQLFFVFIDRPITDWFTQNIIRQTKTHRNRAQLGFMMLYD